MSGTSMSAPHVAGSAALAIQAHPQWSAEDVALDVVHTADATHLAGFSGRLGGNGLVQPALAVRSSVIARTNGGSPSLNFGISESTRDVSRSGTIKVENRGSSAASLSVSVVSGPGSPHTLTASTHSLTVAAGEDADLFVNLAVPASTVGDSSALRQVQGRIVLTPTSGNDGVAVSVPYYGVVRARSIVQARTSEDFLGGRATTGTVQLTNRSNRVSGTADFYEWGLRGTHASLGSIGLRAVGVQSFDNGPPFGQLMVFAINTFGPWFNAATNQYDILLDVDGDGVPDYDVRAADFGRVTTGSPSGQMGVFVFNLATKKGSVEPFLAYAPTNGDTLLVPVVASDAGITPSNPRFSYVIESLDRVGSLGSDAILTPVSFNAFTNSISTSAFVSLAPGQQAGVPVSIDRAEFARTPSLGVMVVAIENASAEGMQALLVPLGGD